MSEHFKRITGNLQNRSREPVVPRPNDILLGRGRTRWGGNKMLDMEIQRNARRYGKAETKHEKTTIVRDIIRTVQKWGRFLDQEPQQESHGNAAGGMSGDGLSSEDWYLATYVKIRKKVGQALRYQMSLIKLEPSVDGSNVKQSTTSARGTSSTGIPFDTGGMALTIPFLQLQDAGDTSTRKRATLSQKHLTEQNTTASSGCDNSSESSTTSSTSFDVSLSALIAFEEEEARARGETCDQEVLVSDEEILAVVLGHHDFYYNNALGERTRKGQSVADRTGIPFDTGGMAPTIPFLQLQDAGYTTTRKRVKLSQKQLNEHNTTTSSGCDSSSESSNTSSKTSFDVSLSALIAFEEEEARARGETCGQQQVLVSDEEILAVVLGYHDFYYNNALGERTRKRQSVADGTKGDADVDADAVSTLFDAPMTEKAFGSSIDIVATAAGATSTTGGGEDYFSSDGSSLSVDISLTTLVAVEEEEEEDDDEKEEKEKEE